MTHVERHILLEKPALRVRRTASTTHLRCSFFERTAPSYVGHLLGRKHELRGKSQ